MNAVSIRSLVYIALCSAVFIVFSAIQLKMAFSPVPITLQTMALIIAGMLLKPRAAFVSVAIVLVLGLFGLPVFGGKSGLTHILGPTGGFLLYFPFGAMLVSVCIEALEKRTSGLTVKKIISLLVIFLLFSSWLAYVVGVPWFMYNLKMSLGESLGLACYPYLLGDAIKAVVSVAIFAALYKPIMKLRGQQHTAPASPTTTAGAA